jgi:hypothetical protein
MLALANYLHLILYILLGTSAATLALLMLSLLTRPGRWSTRIDAFTKLIAAVTSVGALVVSVLNASTPIGPSPTPDEAKRAVEEFYDALQDRNFDIAYRLIHRARIDEIRETIPNFDRNMFAATYATTREYRNILIEPLKAPHDTTGRMYATSFDVSDEVPRNRLYESRQALVKDLGTQGLVNPNYLVSSVIRNLREFYDVPTTAEPAIRDYVLNRQFESILDPIFLSEIIRNLSVDHHLLMRAHVPAPSSVIVWRHFLEDIRMQTEEGNWKIRGGLAVPRAIANYEGASTP